MIFKNIVGLTIIALIIWLIPFIIRMSLPSVDNKVNSSVSEKAKISDNVVKDIFGAYSQNNRKEVFKLIFFNNIKVAIINIVGGIFLGLGTFVNLAQNGFYAADVFCSIHKNGMSWLKILEYTAPHSFEMIGIWLSGGLGFYIAKLVIGIMVKNKYPTTLNYKIITISAISIGLIILFAAYIEAFISVK
ncbi:MAG: stage II sporulation protein M [Salinivirgaceae bacterium]|nr:stage II sporulation protein M [Salinivirgaceae bacterium]